MITIIKKINKIYMSLSNKLTPSFLFNIIEPEVGGIIKFMEFASKKVKPTDKVLDAGAGSCPYKKYFSHARYESTDFRNIFDKSAKKLHTFICSLDKIPRPDNYYDVIINTQVLEHVENPQIVLNEFYRILKPNSKLFLTAPQGWGIHGKPYNFFNFTKYGLELLFKNAGFKVVFIKPKGGIFWDIGRRIKMVPDTIIEQYLIKGDSKGGVKLRLSPLVLFLLPFYIVFKPICEFLIPFLFFYLDFFDKRKNFTLGYCCYCIKK